MVYIEFHATYFQQQKSYFYFTLFQIYVQVVCMFFLCLHICMFIILYHDMFVCACIFIVPRAGLGCFQFADE